VSPTHGAARVLEGLERRVQGYGATRAVVAFSGGVDSSVALAVSARALGTGRVVAVTAVSPSYPAGELEAAAAVAASIGVQHRSIHTGEVEREAYARNDSMRCYHCKAELYGTLRRIASEGSPAGRVVVAGANADDLLDVRPGLLAADQQGIRNPLLENGVGKDMVRAVARLLGLAVADKPALACLSSRVTLGIRITPELLARIDEAERMVRGLGFAQVRVRHLGARASIEIEPEGVDRLRRHPALPDLMRGLRALGWEGADVDPRGYRTASAHPVAPLPRGA
jgi:pyridinium-3,5-biscarboxylic acid mononucleotide sulfurtransferase